MEMREAMQEKVSWIIISPERNKSILHWPADVLNFIDLIKAMLKSTTKCPLSTKTAAQFP